MTMAGYCSVCVHPNKKRIDKEILDGVPLRTIGEWSGLPHTNIHKHKMNHLPGTLVKAREAKELLRADSLLEQLQDIKVTTTTVLERAQRARKHDLVLKAVARREKQIELEGRLIGELTEQNVVNVLVASPEWLKVRATVLSALADYPEARQAVVEALTAEAPNALSE